jgi:integrase
MGVSGLGSVRSRKDNGLLFIDFRYKGIRYRELTSLADTPANRKRLGRALERINADIAAGTFEYQKVFPNGKNAAKFDAPTAMPAPNAGSVAPQTPTPLFRDFAEVWYQEKEVEWRRSYRETMRATLDKALFPEFGDRPVGEITKADVLAYRAKLGKVIARGKQSTLSAARINKIMNPLRKR